MDTSAVSIPIQIIPTSDSIRRRRRGEPITIGVPIPRGKVREEGSWEIVGEQYQRSVQASVLEQWPDGSARWVLLDFAIDHDGESTLHASAVWTPSAAAQPSHASEIVVIEDAGGVTVNTGSATFRIRSGATAFPFESMSLSGRVSPEAIRGELRIVTEDGQACTPSIQQIVIEERGPARAVALVTFGVRLPRGQRLEMVGRVHFFAGSSVTRLLIRVRNPSKAGHPGGFWDLGSSGSIFLKEFALVIALTDTSKALGVRCSPEFETPLRSYQRPFQIYQDSSGGENWNSAVHINRQRQVPVTFRGYRLRSGEAVETQHRATPIVQVTRGEAQVTAVRPQFWQNFPTSMSADDNSLTVGFWAKDFADAHELQGGEQKTHEVFVAFGSDSITELPFDWCRDRLLGLAAPRWVTDTGAVAFLPAVADGERGEYEALVQAGVVGPQSFEAKREVIDEYGWRHFGELYGDHESVRSAQPLASHYNNQYDAVHGMVLQWLRTADRRWWACMQDLARHVIDIDVYHTTEDKYAYNHGMFWHTYHYGDADTATHRTHPRAGHPHTHGGGPSADHNYSTGLMEYFFLTGDPDARATAIDLANYVITLDDGNQTVFRWLSRQPTGYATASGSYDFHGPGRSPANSLISLLNGHRLTGEARFLDKAELLIRRCVHPAQDLAPLRLLENIEFRWFYLMFLQSLAVYLDWKAQLGQLDRMYAYGRDVLLHYARWMARNEYPYLDKPELLEFPTETWAAQEMRKSDVFAHAARYADGRDRALFMERAEFFWRNSVTALESFPTRALCRPIVVLLSSGLMYPWLVRHPEDSAPRGTTFDDFASFETFVPQKARAKRRLKQLVLAGIVGLAGAAALAATLFFR
jgi:hypothetical protein